MDEYRELLGSILAVIHGDGGHRQSKIGTAAATCEAQDKWLALIAERDGWKLSAETRQATCDQLARLVDEWKRRAGAAECRIAEFEDDWARVEDKFPDVPKQFRMVTTWAALENAKAIKERDEWKRRAEAAELDYGHWSTAQLTLKAMTKERDALAALVAEMEVHTDHAIPEHEEFRRILRRTIPAAAKIAEARREACEVAGHVNQLGEADDPERCAAVKKLIEFVRLYGGVAPLVLTTNFNDDGHCWVRGMGDERRTDGLMYWCAWCGVHRVEMSNWAENPPCPAVGAAKELKSVVG